MAQSLTWGRAARRDAITQHSVSCRTRGSDAQSAIVETPPHTSCTPLSSRNGRCSEEKPAERAGRGSCCRPWSDKARVTLEQTHWA